MILLREIQERDLDALEKLAQTPGFINLTSDKDALRDKIQHSINSFKEQASKDGKYIFVAEDIETKEVFGTAMVAAQHGTVESPHFYFEVGSEERFSETINTGFIHGTLKLKYETNGPSEIGGLVIDPAHRNSPEKVGRQISFVRFLFVGLNRQRFKKRILAELLPPLNKKGQSPLWEAIGRRFTNMDYWEADRLCQQNKEFIFSLFPAGKVYTTFLPAEARNAIGKVNKETEPVKHMLEKIGFRYKNQVDPFDGGPHLWANVDEIVPIQKISRYSFDSAPAASSPGTSSGTPGLLCKAEQRVSEFRAVAVEAQAVGERLHLVESTPGHIDRVRSVLGLSQGDAIVFMPFY